MDWKAHPVTKAIMEGFRQRIRAVEEELGQIAGVEPSNDRFKVGAIAGYLDILNVSFDEVSNDD